MTDIQYTVRTYRNRKSTNWLLRQAINDPNCIIVSMNEQENKRLIAQYNWLLKNSSWYLKLKWKFKKPNYPTFISMTNLDYKLRGHNLPLVFDHSCLA